VRLCVALLCTNIITYLDLGVTRKKKKKKDAMAMDNQTSSMHIYACVINKANCSYTEREIEWSEIDDKDNI
jgi:hypothetical protein